MGRTPGRPVLSSPSHYQRCSGPHRGSGGAGMPRPRLTSAQETPPGSAQPAGTEGRGPRCPAGPASAPGGFCTEDSPSVTPSAPRCFFLPEQEGKTRGLLSSTAEGGGTGCTLTHGVAGAAGTCLGPGPKERAGAHVLLGLCSVSAPFNSITPASSKFRKMALGLNNTPHKA